MPGINEAARCKRLKFRVMILSQCMHAQVGNTCAHKKQYEAATNVGANASESRDAPVAILRKTNSLAALLGMNACAPKASKTLTVSWL